MKDDTPYFDFQEKDDKPKEDFTEDEFKWDEDQEYQEDLDDAEYSSSHKDIPGGQNQISCKFY